MDEDGLNSDTDSYPNYSNLLSGAMAQNEHAPLTFQQLVRLLRPGVPMQLIDLDQLIPKEPQPSRGTHSLVMWMPLWKRIRGLMRMKMKILLLLLLLSNIV